MSPAISIDFGTSNSTVGFSRGGKPSLIALEEGKQTLPSAIFFDKAQQKTLFGRQAVAAYVDSCEGRLLRALKSILGSSLIDETTDICGTQIPFKMIIGKFICHLKAKAEEELHHAVDSVVMGRPVWFVDENEKADHFAQQNLEEIARSCGFKHICFQYEPIAAALDYEQSVTREELALIVDIGGGTSDFSIVRVSPDRRGKQDRKNDILANTGVHVGGTDLDKRLSLDQVMPLLGYGTQVRAHFNAHAELDIPSFYFHDLATWHKIPMLYNHKIMRAMIDIQNRSVQPDLVDRLVGIIQDQNGHRLAGDVESAKIELSEHDSIVKILDYVEKGFVVTFTKNKFEAAITRERNKIVKNIQACLKMANVDASQINTLFLTGGSTAVSSLSEACRKVVPSANIVEGDRFGSVGIGLAIEAGIRFV